MANRLYTYTQVIQWYFYSIHATILLTVMRNFCWVLHMFQLWLLRLQRPYTYSRYKRGLILKINIGKWCLGIRSFRRSLAAPSFHWSLATWKANNWRRSASDRCGRSSPFRPPLSTAAMLPRPGHRGTVLVGTLVSVRRSSWDFARLPTVRRFLTHEVL